MGVFKSRENGPRGPIVRASVPTREDGFSGAEKRMLRPRLSSAPRARNRWFLRCVHAQANVIALGYRESVTIITTTADLAAVCKRMAKFAAVTVDTEFMRDTT